MAHFLHFLGLSLDTKKYVSLRINICKDLPSVNGKWLSEWCFMVRLIDIHESALLQCNNDDERQMNELMVRS